MSRRAGVLVVWAAVAAWGCASAPSDDGGAASATDGECVTGVVVAEGMDIAPRTLVRGEDGATTELLGAFAGNVRRLTGATVRACGPGRTPDGSLEVTRVDMVSVDGMPAVIGTLRSVVSGWAVEPLDGGEPVLLASVPTRLEAAEDEVVWVAGPAAERALSVRSFAVLEGWR